MSRLCRVWRYNRIDATGVFSSWVTALMNAPCCSFLRISRTRKIVLSTTPVMISGKARTPRISIPAWRQLTMTQPMLSASAPADRQTPRTMKNAMDFRRPPDVIRHSIAARGESLASHRDGRGAPLARRDDREYREYLREEQRSRPGVPNAAAALGWSGDASLVECSQTFTTG